MILSTRAEFCIRRELLDIGIGFLGAGRVCFPFNKGHSSFENKN